MKNIKTFYLKIFIFLVVKVSVYLNRRVLVMRSLAPDYCWWGASWSIYMITLK